MKRFFVMAAVVALVAFTSSAFAQQRGGRGFGGGGVATLLAIEEVQNELKLTADQKEKLQALRSERPDRSTFQDLSREERQKRFEELAKKTEETIKTTLDETQQKRLEELRIQREGAEALARPDLAEKLGLEQAQKDKIREIVRATDSNQRGNFRDATQEERQKLIAEARHRQEKRNADLLAVLTAAQKETFEKMQGAKFTFPERRRNNNNNN